MWRVNTDGSLSHRPRWKVILNTLLRIPQRRPIKWVVFTKTTGSPPVVVGYGFGPIRHLGEV